MENRKKSVYTSVTFLLLACLLISCGTSNEVRTVDEEPRRVAESASAEADTADSYYEISIGIIDPVDTFDPLFANNLSSMRVQTLVYDGLFTINQHGSVAKAIANEVSVSDDSLTYTVSLKTDLFYHDNPAFISGVGRRLQASDIKWAFERTAKPNVPTLASNLLMNIDGYEEYFEDQRNIYDPDRRALDEVSGIRVVNPGVIRFELIEPDPDFTKKLASPYLVIYPREAVQREGNSLKTNPVGTGAYVLRSSSETSIILTKDNSERSEDRLTQPELDRIEFAYSSDESQLFQMLARDEIQWIPEVGPETKRVVINDEGDISSGYNDEYTLNSAGYRYINFYLNDTRRANMNWLNHRLAGFHPDSIESVNEITIVNAPAGVEQENIGEPDSSYLITFTSDYFARGFLTKIQQTYLQADSEFAISDIRTPVSRTAVYTSRSDSFHRPFLPQRSQPWLTYTSAIMSLHDKSIEGISSHRVPWKLFIEAIRTEGTEEGGI